MVSSDCAEKARCTEAADAMPPDVTVTDETDSNPVPSESGDTVMERAANDAGSGDGDAGQRDVTSDDVATEAPSPNGSCNSACTSAPQVPTGWSGPALFWTAPSGGQQAPNCPMGYQPLDLGSGLTGGSADTCACTCVADETCTVTMTFYPDNTCSSNCGVPGGGTAPIRVTPASDGGCTQVPINSCGSGGAASTTLPVYAATCEPQVTTTPGSAPRWTKPARLCTWAGDAGGPCDTPDAACIVGPTTGFASTACVFRLGESLPCPTTYPTSSGTFYGVTDTRDCIPCTCSMPIGGSCSGDIAAYGDNACGDQAWTDSVLGSCQTHLALVPNPGSVRAVSQATGVPGYTFASATCSVVSGPQPTGSVMQTGATTVCCE